MPRTNTRSELLAFMRTQPNGRAAKDIVEEASKRGITISTAQVYNLRSAIKHGEKPAPAKRKTVHRASAHRSEPSPQHYLGAVAPRGKRGPTADLHSAIAAAGLQHVRRLFEALFDELESRYPTT